MVGKTDYAMCAGHEYPFSFSNPQTPSPDYPGPTSIEGASTHSWQELPEDSVNGVSYRRSEIRPAHIRDGESSTYLVGEKYMNPRLYTTGMAGSDGRSWNVGFCTDIYKWVQARPSQDAPGQWHNSRFGSPHSAGWHCVFCDGSVHLLRFNIDVDVHRRLGVRNDGTAVNLGTLR